MSPPGVASPRRPWSIIARVVAWLSLVAALLVLLLAVYLWPWLLACSAGGAFIAALPRVAGRFGAARVAATVAGLGVVIATVVLVSGSERHSAGFGVLGAIQLARYSADLQFVKRGDWSGSERFELTRAQAREFSRPGSRRLASRLAAAVRPGWMVRPVGARSFWVVRTVPSQPFTIPERKPLTVTTSIRVPRLQAPTGRRSVIPGANSTLTLHAPAERIHATTPASAPQPEAGSASSRTVKLDAGFASGVDVEVKSDLAAELPDAWLAPTAVGVLAAVFSTLGVSFVAVGTLLLRPVRWLLGRGGPKASPRTTTVLRGAPNKTAALGVYVAERGRSDELDTELALVVHEAKRLSREALNVVGGAAAHRKYERALRRLTAAGTPELDAVYGALREAGVPDGELRVVDVRLDETILARHEGPAG